MLKRVTFIVVLICGITWSVSAQVQVRYEPKHHQVLVNQYFRVLDVHVPPHDSTLYHIHSIASVVLIFSNDTTATQLKGQAWVRSVTHAGDVFYRDYGQDSIIHRVGNLGGVEYHVTDIELLSAYQPDKNRKPLPLTQLFTSEKALAWRFTDSSLNKVVIRDRGPMIAGLVEGDDILLHDTTHHKLITIKAKKETYIEPGISFYFSATSKKSISLVLFELK